MSHEEVCPESLEPRVSCLSQVGEWQRKVELPTISLLLTQAADAMFLALCFSMSAKCRLIDPTDIYRASTMGQAGTVL